MTEPRWKRYKRKYNHKPTDEYCGGFRFDQSNMDEIEFERLLLWSGQFPKYFTKRHDAKLTAEVYRRAAQIRATRIGQIPEDKRKPVEMRVVGLADLPTTD